MAVYKGKGIVWNPKKNKVLHNFNRGPYTTTDEQEQEILRKAGYKGDFEDEYVIIEDDEPDEEENIRQKAKGLGIKSWHVKNIDKLKTEIEIKEGELNECS